ncbi:MAG TPA: 1-phosphofructokinase family hexose kinase [Ramlibacter sp.]|nr:1-phosphofructokinase family hexose kinase [Ramlibacter sp.]
MASILTVTLNPALDMSTSASHIEAAHKVRCAPPRVHPGGGGINVARVLQRLGSDCLAVYPIGGSTGDRVRRLLDDEGVRSRVVQIKDETRESFSVHESATGLEYRFVLPGPTLEAAEWQACLHAVSAQAPPPRFVVASGSLPPGVPTDFHARLARLAHAHGSLFVLDSSGEALAAALKEGVHVVKPSLRELRELTGQALATAEQWTAAAQRLARDGCARFVALSLGERGAVLATAERAWRADALAVQVRSTIGAGDSFTAAFVWSLSRGEDAPTSLRHAMAAGAAAVMSPGTALCQAEEIARLLPAVNITEIG